MDLAGARFEPAYWQGLRQPAFIFEVNIFPVAVSTLVQFDKLVASLFPQRQSRQFPQVVAGHAVLSRLSGLSLDMLEMAGMPVMSGVAALQLDTQGCERWSLGVPAVSADMTAPTWIVGWAVKLMIAVERQRPLDIEKVRQDMHRLLHVCSAQAPSGINSLRFLQAAHEAGIPWSHVTNNVYRFGWGSKAHWMDSSFTDETPRISAKIARDKLAACKVLREAGLPVPRHIQVASEEQALAAAQSIGYPVVVKPVDLDGGHGVFTGLRTPDEVTRAYAKSTKFSQRILIEQHIEGNDYRLQVYRHEVFWVVHRRPAYVIGDDESTVAQLIERTNQHREHRPMDPFVEQGSKAIVADDEVRDWLANQALSLESIPASGRHVRLRGAANVNAGGTREAVMHKAHPDNLALAVRAARAMRLDLAGVDLLISDISRSWRETGAAICEINSQPQMATGLHRWVLSRLVPGKGRIPVIAIAGMPALNRAIRESLVAASLSHGIRLGWAERGYAGVAGEDFGELVSGADAYVSCRALLANPDVDALVWHMSAPADNSRGIPVDVIDVLVLGGDMPAYDPSKGDTAFLERALVARAATVWKITSEIDSDSGAGCVPEPDLPERILSVILAQPDNLSRKEA